MKALLFEQFGGPEVLRYAEIPDPDLSLGHIIVRTKAIGLNFADVYRRRGNYHLAGNPPLYWDMRVLGSLNKYHRMWRIFKSATASPSVTFLLRIVSWSLCL